MLFGAPMIWVGGNKHVSWTLTSAGSDQTDFFRLTTPSNNQDTYILDSIDTNFEMQQMGVLQ